MESSSIHHHGTQSQTASADRAIVAGFDEGRRVLGARLASCPSGLEPFTIACGRFLARHESSSIPRLRNGACLATKRFRLADVTVRDLPDDFHDLAAWPTLIFTTAPALATCTCGGG